MIVRQWRCGYVEAALADTRIQICGRITVELDGRRVEGYEQLRTVLRDELGATPSPLSQAPHRHLLGAGCALDSYAV